jgi:hypothetical protein
MAYNAAEARQDLLDTVAEAIDEIGTALALLGEAYELVDEHTADQLEELLFRPAQLAYARSQRTHAGFAARIGLPERVFAQAAPGGVPANAREAIDDAVASIEDADLRVSELQDSMLPVDVGDAELRAGLAEVRRILSPLPEAARRLERVLGR